MSEEDQIFDALYDLRTYADASKNERIKAAVTQTEDIVIEQVLAGGLHVQSGDADIDCFAIYSIGRNFEPKGSRKLQVENRDWDNS